MKIRSYNSTDLESVVNLFTASIHEMTVSRYDAVQRDAWAPCPADLGEWTERLNKLRTLIAESKGEIAGFIAYELTGHIDLLFVSPHFARQGVASTLYRAVESSLSTAGVEELFVEASMVARPFFERQGFYVKEEQNVSRRGVTFRRYAMRKSLNVIPLC